MDESARRMYLVVALASLAIIVVVSVYGIVESLYVFCSQWGHLEILSSPILSPL